MAHEQTSVAETHLGTHGHPTDLVEDLSIKIECIQSEDKFSKANKGSGVAGLGWASVKEERQGPESISMRDRGV